MAKARAKDESERTANGKPLRFAALIRVSTEQQAKEGESLRTQTTDIKASVEQLQGKIVEWYGGQEHATPGYEKKEVDRLVADARKKKFDAVIVNNPDRWSRDNDKSKEGLEAFAANQIRFFVGVTEYNLFDPTHLLFLEMSAVIGKFSARNQKHKSISNRIHRARRGIPTGGKLPFGRLFDKKTETWSVDPAKQKLVEDAAKRYLAGEPMAKLAAEYGINHASLHKTLTKRCGDKWDGNFDVDDLKIHEVIPITIPRLLPEKTIKAIQQKAKANRTYEHARGTSSHLLSGRVFCGVCGYALTAQPPNGKGHRYYRHGMREGANNCKLRPRPWVRADWLEQQILDRLFEFYGNPKAIERAIEAAIPDREKVAAIQAKIDKASNRLKALESQRAKTLDRNHRGLISDEETDKELLKTKQEQDSLHAELDKLTASVAHVPSAELIQEASMAYSVERYEYVFRPLSQEALTAFTKDHLRGVAVRPFGSSGDRTTSTSLIATDETGELAAGGNDLGTWLAMTSLDRAHLIELAFGSPLPNGEPAGVYVWPVKNTTRRSKQWRLALRGLFTGEPLAVTQSASY